jgi:hypothetical protein
LPDAVFFSRAVSVSAGATRANVEEQVSIALESLSPFPLAQLYHGYYWPEGAASAFAFASYRRRFTADQMESWAGAERVIPTFAAILGIEAGPSTTAVLASEGGLTALHWDLGNVPSLVVHRAVPADAAPEERAAARAAVIAACGASARVVDLAQPTIVGGGAEGEIVAETGPYRSVIAAAAAAGLDVRDKADLAALARARGRGLLLWGATLAAVAACGLCVLCELGLLGAGLWQKARVAKLAAQRPTVAHIMEEQELAVRIDELSTRRLLPLEMISAASPSVAMPKNPSAIQFIRATAGTLDTIQIEAQTSNAGEIPGYKSALERSPGVERVEIEGQRARDNVVTFTLVVVFKAGALTPAAS